MKIVLWTLLHPMKIVLWRHSLLNKCQLFKSCAILLLKGFSDPSTECPLLIVYRPINFRTGTLLLTRKSIWQTLYVYFIHGERLWDGGGAPNSWGHITFFFINNKRYLFTEKNNTYECPWTIFFWLNNMFSVKQYNHQDALPQNIY